MNNSYPLCFWKLRKVEPEVHILGSLHSVSASTFPFAAHIERAIDRAEIAVFEVGSKPLDTSVVIANRFKLPIEERLSSELQLFAKLRKVAAANSFDLADVDDFALWLVGYFVSAANLERFDKPMATGVDRYVRQRCEGRVQFEELETKEEQVAGLTTMSAKGQIEFLRSILDEIEERTADEQDKTEQAWREGNVEFFSRCNEDIARKRPEEHKILHIDRNRIWTDNILRVLETKKRTLIIGGAAHFVGEDSVLQILKRDYGIRAERIGS